MAKSKIEKLTDLSEVQVKGDQKEQDKQFQTLTADLENRLSVSAKEGKRSFVVYESGEDKDYRWHGIDAKGQQNKFNTVRRIRGLMERVFLYCKELELDPEVDVCTFCKKARVVIRW